VFHPAKLYSSGQYKDNNRPGEKLQILPKLIAEIGLSNDSRLFPEKHLCRVSLKRKNFPLGRVVVCWVFTIKAPTFADKLEEGLMKAKLLVFPVLLSLASAWGQANQTQVTPQAEERLQKEVRHQLLLLPRLSVFDNLAYKVEGYKVTLLGQVTDPVEKSDAENAVKHVEGVEQVDNQIEVLPLSPMDNDLRRKLYVAIYGYPGFEKYAMPVVKPIRIIVKNGHVTLEGVVDSEADKNLAGLRANGVPGVFSVTNNLQVVK